MKSNTVSVSFDINNEKRDFGIKIDKKETYSNKDIYKLFKKLSLAAVRCLEREKII